MLPIEKLEQLARRFQELEHLLCSPAALANHTELQRLNKERTDLEPVVAAFARLRDMDRRIADNREMLDDPELGALAHSELHELEAEKAKLEGELEMLLLPKDPNDERNTILEIRSGEGGEEAALFAADIFRMICRYAETRRWRVEVLNTSEASAGGLKEVIALVTGQSVYSHLRYEGGVHRVQRVPATEAQGRIHTSTATVAVLPEANDVDVHIDERELDISIAASGGPGGQGVNTTNSAVQIRHIPTGIIVKCQDERSQLKNKAKALKVLKSRLLELEQRRQDEALSAERRTMVGTGERAQKIRTYNFPQNRVTDHRIGLTLHKLDKIMEGDLDDLIAALRTHRQAELLKQGGVSGARMKRMDRDALLVALVLAPATYSRNRFFQLYADPEMSRVRRRASQIRGIVRHVTRADMAVVHRGASPQTPAPPVHDGASPQTPAPPVHDGASPQTPAPPVHDGASPQTPAPPVHDGASPQTPAPPVREGLRVSPSGQDGRVVISYEVPAIGLRRTATLDAIEISLVRFALARANERALGPDDPDRALVEAALRRLSPWLADGRAEAEAAEPT